MGFMFKHLVNHAGKNSDKSRNIIKVDFNLTDKHIYHKSHVLESFDFIYHLQF